VAGKDNVSGELIRCELQAPHMVTSWNVSIKMHTTHIKEAPHMEMRIFHHSDNMCGALFRIHCAPAYIHVADMHMVGHVITLIRNNAHYN
jgi:hypothetical protein